MGEEWKKLSAGERQKYEHLADEDRTRYHREMQEYQANSEATVAE